MAATSAAAVGTTIAVGAAQGTAATAGGQTANKMTEAGAKRGLGGKIEKGVGTMFCSSKLKEKGERKQREGREERDEAREERREQTDEKKEERVERREARDAGDHNQ